MKIGGNILYRETNDMKGYKLPHLYPLLMFKFVLGSPPFLKIKEA